MNTCLNKSKENSTCILSPLVESLKCPEDQIVMQESAIES